jgi:hypothetical protein
MREKAQKRWNQATPEEKKEQGKMLRLSRSKSQKSL